MEPLEDFNMSTTFMTTMNESFNNSGTDFVDPKDAIIKLSMKVINVLILTFLMISMGCTIDFKNFKETVSM